MSKKTYNLSSLCKSLMLQLLLLLVFTPLQASEIQAISRFNYYTSESSGEIIVYLPEDQVQTGLEASLWFKGKIIGQKKQLISGLNLLPFPLTSLELGDNDIICKYYLNNEEHGSENIKVQILAPKYNMVKIDRANSGLIVDGLPFFPFGFYCYSPVQPTLAEEEVVKGFNMMSPYQEISDKTRNERRKYMDRCAQLGMKVHYNLLSIGERIGRDGGFGSGHISKIDKDEQLRLLKEEINAFKDHPALLAWYISDEPVGRKVPPEPLIEIYQLIKKLDPYHPVSVVFMTPNKAKDYAEAMDIVMADPYPIPRGTVLAAGNVAKGLYEEFYPEKPVWIVPQAFGGNEWWTREPTSEEIRVMTYLAIINGSRGIQYFIRHGMNSFPKSTVAWNECGRIALEIAELTPTLLSTENAPVIACTDSAIQLKAFRYRNEITILAVNTVNKPKSIEIFMQEEDYSGEAEVQFENRKIKIRNGVINGMIDAFGRKVYRFDLEETREDSKIINPQNLVLNSSFEMNPSIGVPSGCYARHRGDRGSTYFVDSRIAFHGNHSIRMTTPTEEKGFALSFFPVRLKKGAYYTISVWAKAMPKDPQFEPLERRGFFKRLFSKKKKKETGLTFQLGLGSLGTKDFIMSNEWRKYSFSVKSQELEQRRNRNSPTLELLSPGTAWFDLLEILPDLTLENKPLGIVRKP